jgi:perosamine synthetase
MHKIYEPYLPRKSLEYAKEAIDSGWISSLGDYPEKSSRLLGEKLGVKYALPVNSGTSATHLTAISLKKFFPNIDEVLVPSACYIAAYNSLIYEGYKNIVAIDLDIDTWNMSIDKIKLNKNSAIMAVHNLGGIINVPKLLKNHNSPIIEDNCEGFFGKYEGNPSGSKSFCSSLSFFGNKNITSGEGGAFLTNEKDVYEFALKIHGQGQTSTRYIHDELGYNYRMTNIQAGLLLGQLEEYEYIYSEKKRVFDRYSQNLKNQTFLSLQSAEDGCDHSMWMIGVRFHCAKSFAKSSHFFKSNNIETRPMFYSYDKHTHLSLKGSHTNSDILQNQIAVFPSHIFLKNEEIDEICDRIIAYNSLVFQNWADKNDLI